MGGIIRAITGGESSEQKRARRGREQQADADKTRAEATAKLKKEEAQSALEKSKKKRRTIGRRSSILTSPLGVVDTEASQTLG